MLNIMCRSNINRGESNARLVRLLLWAMIFSFNLSCFHLHAQEEHHRRSLPVRVDSTLEKRYYKTKYDTSYVARPEHRFLFRLLLNQASNHINAHGTVNDVFSKYRLHTRRNTTTVNQNKWLARAFFGVRI